MKRFLCLVLACSMSFCLALSRTRGQSAPGANTRVPSSETKELGGGVLRESLTVFDYRQADLQWVSGHWLLRAGQNTLKDFDRQEKDGREALRIIRDLKLTQLGSIGTPRPILEYWLADGQAPTDSLPGLRTSAFDRDNLRVEQFLGQWCLRDKHAVLCSFGYHEDDARQALLIIQKYGFDQVGYLGHPAPVMMYFVAGKGTSRQHTTSPSLTQSPAANNVFPRTVLHTREQGKPGDDAGSLSGPRLNEAALLANLRQLSHPGVEPAGSSSSEDRVAIDWRRIEMRKEGDNWKLVYGKYTLATLGTSETDAQVAFGIVQHYRFTEHSLIGRPKVLFSYFLVGGQPPHGLCFGARNTPFRPELLTVQKHAEEWVVAESGRPLFHFGDKAQEAKDALQAIHRYHFDCLCEIGSRETPLTFLVRTR